MLIRIGYEIAYELPQPTPMILNLNVHYSRSADLVEPDKLFTDPPVAASMYRDGAGNWCTRLIAPRGRFSIAANGLVRDGGVAEPAYPNAAEVPVESLPNETLVYLLASRYCETEHLAPLAWSLFGATPPGWARVQAICDYAHQHIVFDYSSARPTKTAWDVFQERRGVCRDYAHLAISLCRCLNIPARYCTGYLGDIGVAPADSPMDFAGWFEAYIGGAWHTFDPRNNQRRIGRILIARGRDAVDVAMTMTFGPNILRGFNVQTYEVEMAAV